MSQRFPCVTPLVWELPIILFVSKVACLLRVEYLHLIKLMVVGFCCQGNWAMGSSINVLADLILFRYQTTLKYTIHFKL